MSNVDLLALCVIAAHLTGIGGALVWAWTEKRDYQPNSATTTDKPGAFVSLESRGLTRNVESN